MASQSTNCAQFDVTLSVIHSCVWSHRWSL